VLFESHAHYDNKRFDADRQEVLESLAENEVGQVINVGVDLQSTQASIELALKYDFIHAACGVHPHSAKTLDEEEFCKLRKLAGHGRAVAVGEIGLDFHYDYSPRDTQRYWFKRQLELALSLDMPVVIHSREASAETFKMISDSGVKRGVVHCYSGSAPMALDYIEMGFYIGLGGVLTYDNSRKAIETAEAAPLERILLETDCPFLTPAPYRKKRNDSRYLGLICRKLAEIKQVDVLYAQKITYENCARLFGVG
jgi:TatD DNase family protein